MRITGGKWKGQPITKSKHAIRPLTGRMRETLFAILGDINGMHILDLFAGTGSFSLEALSRGATHVTVVEKNRAVAREIITRFTSMGTTVNVRSMPAERFIATNNHQYHGIFADPPYRYQRHDALVQLIAHHDLLLPTGTLLLHHERHTRLSLQVGNLQQYDQRIIGQSVVSFYTRISSE